MIAPHRIKIVKYVLISIVAFFMIELILYTAISDFPSWLSVALGLTLSCLLLLYDYYRTIKYQKNLLRRYQYDNSYVNREKEYNQFIDFLKQDFRPIWAVSGVQGIGKSSFLKESADKINRLKGKNTHHYIAIYFAVSHTGSILDDFSKSIGFTCGAVAQEVCTYLKTLTPKPAVIIIDEVDPISELEAREMATSICACNRKYKVVLGISTSKNEGDLPLAKFDTTEVSLLESKLNLSIPSAEKEAIVRQSSGIPAYICFLMRRYTNDAIASNTRGDIDTYIQKIVKEQLVDNERLALLTICCYMKVTGTDLARANVDAINSEIAQASISKLIQLALVQEVSEVLHIEEIILSHCIDSCCVNKDKVYSSIYLFFKLKSKLENYCFKAYLHSRVVQCDEQLAYSILGDAQQKNNHFYYIGLGALDTMGMTNPYFSSNTELYTLFRYRFLNALLEVGAYSEAQNALNYYDSDGIALPAMQSCKTKIELKLQLLLANLMHLTNNFELALGMLEALASFVSDKDFLLECRYLQAHILKHMGTNLPEAKEILESLGQEILITNNAKLLVKAKYSLLSIALFTRYRGFDFESTFTQLDTLTEQYNLKHLQPSIDRHRVMFLLKYRKDSVGAKKVLDATIRRLEENPQRIMYDIFFLYGEWCRLQNSPEQYKDMGEEYYVKAQEFAEAVNDINLRICCVLGQILLRWQGDSQISQQDIAQIRNQIMDSQQNKLSINEAYANLLLGITDGAIAEDKIAYWEKMQYVDLAMAARKYNRTQKVDLLLTVM